MTKRLKLLFLTYTFPPLQTSSCARNWSIAKYLSKLGWDVTVVTPSPAFFPSVVDNAELVERELSKIGVRRILTDHSLRLLLSDYWTGRFGSLANRLCRKVVGHFNVASTIGWLKPAKRACRPLSGDDVDVILATGPPFEAFQLARCLGDQLNRPYVLDYRDPWTGSAYADRAPSRSTVRQERELLERAAAVTVVSPSWRSALQRRFHVGSKLHVVTNGYDPEHLARVKPHAFGHFAIVYTGIFYPPKHVVTPLLAALRSIKERNNFEVGPWKFHYYGPHCNHVHQEAERLSMLDRTVIHGRVSREEALSAVAGAGVAAVITNVAETGNQQDKGVIPAKTYEPLFLGTPILLISPEGSDVRQVIKAGTVAQSFTGTRVESIANYLMDLMRRRLTRSSCSTEQYAWPTLAGTLDGILKGVIDPNQRSDASFVQDLTQPTVAT